MNFSFISEILTRADFYRDAQITIPSNICVVVNDLIGVLSPSDRFCYKEVKHNWIIKGIARDQAVLSVYRECRYIQGSMQASFTVNGKAFFLFSI